jgi:hypothetical protein
LPFTFVNGRPILQGLGRLFLIAVLAVGLSWIFSPPASASCFPSTEAQRIAGATIIFEGVALEGPTPTGVQRFLVTEYLKGSGPETGPEIVSVTTGYRVDPRSGMALPSSTSITAEAGSAWRIFAAQGATEGLLETNTCTGSARLPLPPLSAAALHPARKGAKPPTSARHRSRCHQNQTCPSDHATYRWHGLLCVKPTSDKRNRTFTRRVKHAGLTYYCKR